MQTPNLQISSLLTYFHEQPVEVLPSLETLLVTPDLSLGQTLGNRRTFHTQGSLLEMQGLPGARQVCWCLDGCLGNEVSKPDSRLIPVHNKARFSFSSSFFSLELFWGAKTHFSLCCTLTLHTQRARVCNLQDR